MLGTRSTIFLRLALQSNSNVKGMQMDSFIEKHTVQLLLSK